MAVKAIILLGALLLGSTVKADTIGKEANVPITAYCCKGYTSSGDYVREGHIALSRSLEKKHKAKFGDLIHVEGLGIFTFKDRMPYPRWTHHRADIYIKCKHTARRFGKKIKNIEIIRP